MITIIGAGPVGNHAAALLAREGFNVNVFEDHAVIGAPIQCTGITTFFLQDLTPISRTFLVNTITRTRVYSPEGNFVDIPLKKNFVVDRTKFDAYLAEVAQSEGVQYHLKHRYTHSTGVKKITSYFTNGKTFTSDILIGADGPYSQVAKTAGIYGERKFIIGHQARIQRHCEEDLVEFFLGEGYFGWLVPESSKISRLGICSMRTPKTYFDALFKQRKGKILEWQSGPIPLYNPKLQTEKDNTYLIGDAAMQVKATTLGGIIPGMIAGEALARAVKEGKSYQRLWKKSIGKELLVHLYIHRVMQRFTSSDYNTLIKLVQQERVKNAITEHDREFPSKLLLKLLLREPRFLQFGKYLTALL